MAVAPFLQRSPGSEDQGPIIGQLEFGQSAVIRIFWDIIVVVANVHSDTAIVASAPGGMRLLPMSF